MGSTTHQHTESFYLEKAQDYIKRRKWADALKECEGLLNGNNRSFFRSSEVWAMRAIALLWQDRLEDAEYAITESQNPGMRGDSKEFFVEYNQQKLAYYTAKGDIGCFNIALGRLANVSVLDPGWVSMQRGITYYRASTKVVHTTRGYRDDQLHQASRCFKSADQTWEESGDADTATRLLNLKYWLIALANQSPTQWTPSVQPILSKIELLDRPMAKELRRKYRLRKVLGFRIHA